MKTTDYGFLRLILCSNVMWKEVLWGGAASFVYLLFCGLLYGVVTITFSLFADMLGLPGEILREDFVSERNLTPGLHDRQQPDIWAGTGVILVAFLLFGAMSCITTMEIRVTKTKLAVIKDPSRHRNRSVEIYPLCNVEASRGWCLGNWMGIVLRVKDRAAPVCFVLKSRRAEAVIKHVNGRSYGDQ